jgi:hypothetical protein
MRRHWLGLIVGIVTLSLTCGVYSLGASQLGRLEAQFDLLQGKRIYRRCERNCVWTEVTDEIESIMSRDYGVEVVSIDSCTVSGASRRRTDAYNEVQVAELEKIYGKGIIEKVQHQAFDDFQAK